MIDGAGNAEAVLAAAVAAWHRAVPSTAWILCSPQPLPDFDALEIPLGPLSAAEARELAGPQVPEPLLARLGGHPLAIEVASAGLSWSDEGTGDPMGRLWESLSEPDRRELTRLSVFPAGFSADEVAEVFGAGAARPLDGLKDRSLIEPIEHGWRVVGAFRTLAGERGAPPERARAELAHQEWIWRTIDENSALDHARIRRLAPDVGAVVGVWRASDPARAALLAHRSIHNAFALPEAWISWLAEWAVADRRVPIATRARIAARLGHIWLDLGMKQRSELQFRHAFELARQGDADLQRGIAIDCPNGGPSEPRIGQLETLRREAEALHNRPQVVLARLRIAQQLRALGRPNDAAVALDPLLPVPEVGQGLDYEVLNLTGILHAETGRTVTAERAFTASHALAARIGCPVRAGFALMNLGAAAGLRGDAERALRWYAEAEGALLRGGSPLGMAQLLANRAMALLARRELGPAEESLARAEALVADRHNPEIASFVGILQAAVDELRGRLGLAEGRLRCAREIAATGQLHIRVAVASECLAGILAQRGRVEEAEANLTSATLTDPVVQAHRSYTALTVELARGLSPAEALARLAAVDAQAPLPARHRGWALERMLKGRLR